VELYFLMYSNKFIIKDQLAEPPTYYIFILNLGVHSKQYLRRRNQWVHVIINLYIYIVIKIINT